MEISSRYRGPLAALGAVMTALPRRPLLSLFDLLCLWQERSRQRRFLGRLDAHMLRDIGIDRATAQAEAEKPFWRR